MKITKIFFYFLAFSLISFSCGEDDISSGTDVFFNADIDGEPFMTNTINATSLFGLNSIVIPKDNSEITFNFSDTALGTYEVGGTDKILDGLIDATHTPTSGSLTITAYDVSTNIIEGTVDGVIMTSGLPSVSNVTIDNGTFKAKFLF